MKYLIALAALVSVGGCVAVVDPSSPTASAVSPRNLDQALALTPEHFHRTAKVEDDDLDVIAKVNTQGGMVHRAGLLGITWNDNFLRALIDKRTGAVTYQVYQYINYEGEWRFYERVNYETPDGPVQKPVTQISRDVLSCAGSRYSGCMYSEHFAFEVDEELLRTIAQQYRPGEATGWRFKYGAQRAEDWQEVMLPAEIIGFLRAVDEYRASLPARS